MAGKYLLGDLLGLGLLLDRIDLVLGAFGAVLDIDDVALELIDEVALLVWVLLGVVSLHSPRPSRR